MDGSVVFARWRQCASQTNTCFLGPPESTTQNGISIGSAVFAQLTIQRTYTLQRSALSSLKIASSHGVFAPPCNTCFLAPT